METNAKTEAKDAKKKKGTNETGLEERKEILKQNTSDSEFVIRGIDENYYFFKAMNMS